MIATHPGFNGAHDRNRTCDLFLTKEVLYRLSYVSETLPGSALRASVGASCAVPSFLRQHSMERETGIEPAPSAWKAEVLPLNYSRDGHLWSCKTGGGRWIRTTEGVSQQIYSLPPLAAWVSLRCCCPKPVKQPAILTRRPIPVNGSGRSGSHVEAEMEDVALLDPVLLAFQAQPPG